MRVKVCGADNFSERWAVFKELDAAKAKGMTVLYEPVPSVPSSKLLALVTEWATARKVNVSYKTLVRDGVSTDDFDLIIVFDGAWVRESLSKYPPSIIREVC